MVVKVTLQDGVIHLGASLNKFHPPLVSLFLHKIRNRINGKVLQRIGAVLEDYGLHLNEVNKPFKVVL